LPRVDPVRRQGTLGRQQQHMGNTPKRFGLTIGL
jgi:hypothetical protein